MRIEGTAGRVEQVIEWNTGPDNEGSPGADIRPAPESGGYDAARKVPMWRNYRGLGNVHTMYCGSIRAVNRM